MSRDIISICILYFVVIFCHISRWNKSKFVRTLLKFFWTKLYFLTSREEALWLADSIVKFLPRKDFCFPGKNTNWNSQSQSFPLVTFHWTINIARIVFSSWSECVDYIVSFSDMSRTTEYAGIQIFLICINSFLLVANNEEEPKNLLKILTNPTFIWRYYALNVNETCSTVLRLLVWIISLTWSPNFER